MIRSTWIVRMASLRVGSLSSKSLLFMTSFSPSNRLFPVRLLLLPQRPGLLFLFLSLPWLCSPLLLRDLDLLTWLLLRMWLFLLRLWLRLLLRALLLLLTWLLLLPLLRLRAWLLLSGRLLARDLPRLLPRLRVRLRLLLLATCFWNWGSDLTASFKTLADLNASARLYAMFPLR